MLRQDPPRGEAVERAVPALVYRTRELSRADRDHRVEIWLQQVTPTIQRAKAVQAIHDRPRRTTLTRRLVCHHCGDVWRGGCRARRLADTTLRNIAAADPRPAFSVPICSGQAPASGSSRTLVYGLPASNSA